MITRSTLNFYKGLADKIITGYCSYRNLPYEEQAKYTFIGYNAGKYGWNYDLFFDFSTHTCIIDGYRNY